MQTYTGRSFIFACVLLASGVCSASKEDSVSPETLITQARKLHEIWTAGTPPVTMRAEIQVFNGKGGVTPGQYTVNWVSPAKWREDLRFPNYERVRVHDAKGYWQKSGLDFQPKIIRELDTFLNSESVLKIRAKQFLGKVKSHDKDGVRERCTEVKSKTATDWILCFDERNGNLVSLEYPKNDNESPPEISRIEYSAFHELGEKHVPFEIRAFRDKTIVATVKVAEIKPVAEENPSAFVVPANSEFWAQCEGMQEAELVGRVQPMYPESARSNHQSGGVMFYAVVEADGTVSHLTVIEHAAPSLEVASADAIRQWRYRPAACNSTPIRVETGISVYFSLRQ
jgi:Gram-negative bacterial TonB protein C-terminal